MLKNMIDALFKKNKILFLAWVCVQEDDDSDADSISFLICFAPHVLSRN